MGKRRLVIQGKDALPDERFAPFLSRDSAERCTDPLDALDTGPGKTWPSLWGIVERDDHANSLGEITALGESQARNERLAELGIKIGKLVQAKNLAYGNSAGNAGAIMRILYPNGVQPHQYDDALLVVRIIDKLSRIAQRGQDGKDAGGESPFFDIAGYGLLGADADNSRGGK